MNKNFLNHLKVLYVEDEEIIREQLSRFIKRRVGKLFVAKNGEEGIEKFIEYSPDIIITDLKMPKMNGLEMAAKIREIDSICPIIVTTAISDVETLVSTINVGIDKYIIKPINTQELEKALLRVANKITSYNSKNDIVKSIILAKEEKRQMENSVQKELAKFIKHYTGKGPKNVQAFFDGKYMTVQCFETRTPYEKSLLENEQNIRVVDYNRELFYKDKSAELEDILKNVLDFHIKSEEITIDSRLDIDQIKFLIEVV